MSKDNLKEKMEKNTVCELCGKPVEYDPGVILCEACEKDLNKEPEWVPELREEMRINLDIARQEILPPKLTTRRMIAFLIDGLLMATICLLLGGGFWWLIARLIRISSDGMRPRLPAENRAMKARESPSLITS